MSDTAIGLNNEAKIITAVGEGGVKAPEILYVCQKEDGIGDGFIMAHVHGETIARKILRNDEFSRARDVLARQCGEALAGIHKVDTLSLIHI